MDLKLGSRGDFITTGTFDESDLNLSYELPETVTVSAGEATQLSFVMDLNRLLRFETSAKDMRENKAETGGDEENYPSYYVFVLTLSSEKKGLFFPPPQLTYEKIDAAIFLTTQ